MAREKERNTSPPKIDMASMARKVVVAVITVRESVALMAMSMVSGSDSFLYFRIISRMRS